MPDGPLLGFSARLGFTACNARGKNWTLGYLSTRQSHRKQKGRGVHNAPGR